ncbi:hypothetical protein GCM10009748_24990 [Agromyces lapidis]
MISRNRRSGGCLDHDAFVRARPLRSWRLLHPNCIVAPPSDIAALQPNTALIRNQAHRVIRPIAFTDGEIEAAAGALTGRARDVTVWSDGAEGISLLQEPGTSVLRYRR